ncbi:hypothetical protein ACFLZ0_00815 [Patescibacteria group bacterium]
MIPLIRSFFTVIGGTIPIAFLILLFSRKEKERLLSHAEEIKRTLPIQEQLLERILELTKQSINPQDINKGIDNFSKYIESYSTVEEGKKFIKYAESYNLISTVGNILKLNNYIPKNIGEYKEISKDISVSNVKN